MGIWVRKRNVIISLSQMTVLFVNAAAQERLARRGGWTCENVYLDNTQK